MPTTEFFGVTSDPRRGVQPGIGLYEFELSNGAPVRLHDTFLRRLVWEPGTSATLALVFEWAHGWVPAALRDTPLVILRFTGVRIRLWEEDSEPLLFDPRAVEDPSGQVSSFDWDGESRFDLITFNGRTAFTADTVTVVTSPADGVARQ